MDHRCPTLKALVRLIFDFVGNTKSNLLEHVRQKVVRNTTYLAVRRIGVAF